MKGKKVLSAAALSLLIFLGSCAQSAEKAAEDHVIYYNPKRDEVIAQYIGTKTSVTPNADNIKLSYTTSGDGAYLIYVENGSANFFYDGTVELTGGESEYSVNIRMLAPSSACSFKIHLQGDVKKFAYSIVGGFYPLSAAAKIDVDYEEARMDSAPNERLVIVDADAITPEVMDKLARRFYILNTLFNYETDMSYFLVARESYDPGNTSVFFCEMNVNTMAQTVTFKDKVGGVIDSKTY